jgi:ElaB/YqjD/DUF883 family membrane-anchored ribosome-binding protein
VRLHAQGIGQHSLLGRIPHTRARDWTIKLRLELGQILSYHNNLLRFMETRSAEEIEDSTEKLLRDLKAVVHDGEELLRAGAKDLTERGMAARERLAAALEMAKETRRKLQERAVNGARETDRLVREHPYQSIGIAFGVGMLIGILVNRR